jgi:hypothetical protein
MFQNVQLLVIFKPNFNLFLICELFSFSSILFVFFPIWLTIFIWVLSILAYRYQTFSLLQSTFTHIWVIEILFSSFLTASLSSLFQILHCFKQFKDYISLIVLISFFHYFNCNSSFFSFFRKHQNQVLSRGAIQHHFETDDNSPISDK